MRVHERSADDAIVSIEVDKVKVHLVLDPADVYRDSRSVAYLGSASYTP